MATTSFTLSTDANTTELRNWGAAIKAALAAVGLVQTADTGQPDWTTVTYSAGAKTIGTEFWAFSDTLQSTKPIYLKVAYMQGSSNGFYLVFTPSTGTSGAGASSGLVGNSVTCGFSSAAAQGGLAKTTYVSGDGSYLAIALAWGGSSGFSGSFYIDRTRDTAGAITNKGCLYGAGLTNSTSGSQCQSINFVTGTLVTISGTIQFPGAIPLTATTMISGTNVGLVPAIWTCNGEYQPPILASLAYFQADITDLTTISVSVSGSAHTYLCIGTTGANASSLGTSLTACRAMRWE